MTPIAKIWDAMRHPLVKVVPADGPRSYQPAGNPNNRREPTKLVPIDKVLTLMREVHGLDRREG